jgi:ribosomal protein S12 methylthiotransferase accessory factor
VAVLYDDAQYARTDFPFAPFDPKKPIHWTRGRWLDTGEVVQLPALATHMHFPAEAAERFGQTTSNGLAAGATFEDAALGALYELIERDAFMLFWLARRPALRLAANGCSDVSRRALREVERLGARTELYLLDAGTQHSTVVCLGLGDGRSWPGVTIGLVS